MTATASTGPILEVRDLHVHYGAIHAVKGVSFSVWPNEIVTLIGANGAGKSSTLAAIVGLIRSSSGTVLLAGRDITGQKPERVLREGAALAPEGRGIFAQLSVRENLQLGAFIRKDRAAVDDDIEAALAHFPILRTRIRQPAGTLSGGEQQMLAIARALMARPRILLLDEPSLGLAPLLVRKIYEILAQLHAEGMTILLVEQNAQVALDLADTANILEVGELVLSGPAPELASSDRVRECYLGG